MVETTPKSPEQVQAQIAAFTAERVEHYQDSKHIFRNLGGLALGEMQDITRTTNSTEYHRDENGDTIRLPEGTEHTVATSSEYADFLRSVGGQRYEAIQGRAEMLGEYSHFKPSIMALRTELADPEKRKGHPNFLGNGSNATVFSISEGDKKYAVRVPNGRATDPSLIDSHLAGAVLGKDVPHLEQIVAASYEDGVTVAELMPGKEIGQLTLDEIEGITDEQLGELVDTLAVASERGIEIDPKPSNFLYDSEAGYGIVDYHSSKVAGKNSKDQSFNEIIGWTAASINNTGLYDGYRTELTHEDYSHDLEFMKANLGVLERYRSVVEAKASEAAQIDLTEIDKIITTSKERVDNYSNPEWVAERIAQEQQWRRQREEDAKTPVSDTLDLM